MIFSEKSKLQYFIFFLFLFFILSNSLVLKAQGDSSNPPKADLSTPRQAVITHLKYLQSETYFPEISAKAFNVKTEQKVRIEYAIKLKQILDGRGLYVYPDSIPDNPKYIDTVTNEYRFVLFEEMPEIYLVRANGKWMYSIESIKSINRLHAETYPLGLDLLLEYMPVSTSHRFLGIDTWKILALLFILIIGYILHRVLRYIFKGFLISFAKKLGRQRLVKELIKPITQPLGLLIVFNLLVRIIPVLQLPVVITKYILLFVNIATPIFVMMIAYNLIDYLIAYFQRFTEKTESTLDDQLVPLTRKTLKVLVVIFGILYILSILDFNVNALVAGISIGGIAFALAAQDTIKNFFGSVTIFIDRPFQLGDWVVGNGIDGTIEEIGFRSTRVRTFHNSLIYVPNGKMADMTIDNMGMRQYRRYSTRLTITYDTPPELIEAFIYGLRRLVEEHPNTRKDVYHIYLNNFASTSLEILFYIFFDVADWGNELKAKHEIMLQIMRLADKLGVRFAFPTQTLHIEDMPEKQSLTPNYDNLEENHLHKEVEDFLKIEQALRKQDTKFKLDSSQTTLGGDAGEG